MPDSEEQNRAENQSGASEQEVADAQAKHTTVEAIKAEELARTGGRAKENPIAEMLDEGHEMGHRGGQLRGDQTEGHRGGSHRQNLNRGRD